MEEGTAARKPSGTGSQWFGKSRGNSDNEAYRIGPSVDCVLAYLTASFGTALDNHLNLTRGGSGDHGIGQLGLAILEGPRMQSLETWIPRSQERHQAGCQYNTGERPLLFLRELCVLEYPPYDSSK